MQKRRSGASSGRRRTWRRAGGGSGRRRRRADLYALGAMVYELVTGERPWHGDAPFAVAAARLIYPPPDPRAFSPTSLPPWPRSSFGDGAGPRDCFDSAAAAAAFAHAAQRRNAEPRLTHGFPRAGASGARSRRPSRRPAHDRPPKDHRRAPLQKRRRAWGRVSRGRGDRGPHRRPVDDARPQGPTARGGGGPAGHGAGCARGRRELGVQVVVEGSVRKAATGIRATARLVSTSDGFQGWAKRFERPAEDVLAVSASAMALATSSLTASTSAAGRSKRFAQI